MKIRLFWQGCDFLKKRWTDQNIDSYWIEPFPWYYPYSGQWGAYCPFEAIEEMNIKDLNEVCYDTDDKGEQNV